MGRSDSPVMELLDIDFSNARTSKDIYPIVSLTNDAFINNEYGSVDYVLKNIDFHKQNTLSLICFIRSTYRAKYYIPSWTDTRDRIYGTIENPDKVLRGLYD